MKPSHRYRNFFSGLFVIVAVLLMLPFLTEAQTTKKPSAPAPAPAKPAAAPKPAAAAPRAAAPAPRTNTSGTRVIFLIFFMPKLVASTEIEVFSATVANASRGSLPLLTCGRGYVQVTRRRDPAPANRRTTSSRITAPAKATIISLMIG